MRPLRTYLLTLVVGAVLPLAVLTTVESVGDARRKRAAVEASLVDTSRSLATAVEHELARNISALGVLATSPRLEAGDIPGFREEARASMGQMPWLSVWLADAQGHQLMNLLAPPGSPLPDIGDRPHVRQALLSGKPAVSSGLIIGRYAGLPNVAVVVPRLRDGKTVYLVGAAVQPASFHKILAPADQYFKSATAAIVGSDFLIIARNRENARWMGQRARQDYIDAVTSAPEGFSRTTTLEGDTVYAAYRRLPDSGWIVGIGVLASEVEHPMRRALWASAFIGLSGLGLAGAVAVVLSRRITVPIKRLAATADDIALGRPGAVPQPEASGITEIATLATALQLAATATRERDQLAEHARHIAAELEAAEIRERQQIARDLHDELAQTLSAAMIRLARLQAHADPDVARTAAELAGLVSRADQSTRSLAAQLSPPVLYELGLVPALEWLAQQLASDYQLDIEIQDDGEPKPLSAEVASVVFRCVRELLINVAKHAQAQEASVALLVEDDGRTLAIHVQDGGRGIGIPLASEGGMGLFAVKERLAHLGGSFEIRSIDGGGTDATMRVPLDPASGSIH
ncbi:histidine kinase [Piscinibacter gummiphilus]|uniref:histidine kinase n=1 Tax=Piscinibacter gummiphilus TaxID=946333 RepID=A0ABZ0D5J4_9BURK|nr:cache domain-containing protein [Piscinibacter gummiphilus]WOB10620.1 histidine kinase [Piscinibacter gummiphilus]